MRQSQLFFVHRTEDAPRVAEIKAMLAKAVPKMPFVDVSTNVPNLRDWKVVARPAIESSDAVICIVGATTYSSDPVAWELKVAHKAKRPLVIARLDPTHEWPGICDALELDTMEWDVSRVAASIARALLPNVLFAGRGSDRRRPDHQLLMSQYSVMVQSWEALITRRQSVNSLYLTACTALLGAIGVLMSLWKDVSQVALMVAIVMVALIGLGLTVNWRRTLVAYGVLANAKAAVVTALEDYLPARSFAAEWAVLEANKYRSTTKMEGRSAEFLTYIFIGAITIALTLLTLLNRRARTVRVAATPHAPGTSG